MTTAEHSPLRPKDEALPIAEMSSILERHPNWPHLNVSFYFGPHTHRKDSKDIGPHIEEADICLMENVTPEVADFLQETLADNPPIPPEEMVAKGRFYDRPIEGSYWEPIIHALHGTKKAIGVME